MNIHHAVSKSDVLLVECIIDTKPDVIEHRNTLGRTALLQAAANGSLEITMLLVLKGANVNASSYPTDNASMAIHLAAENGHINILQYLLQVAPQQLEATDKDGDTPLSRACYNGKIEVVKYLIEQGANAEAPGYRCRTPLLRASANGHTAIVELLLNAGANIMAKSNQQDFQKNAVYLAAVFGHVNTVDCLLSREPRLAHMSNIHNDTLICYAALGGHVPVIIQVIDKYNGDIETSGRFGRTPLLQAASMGHLEAVKFLVNRGSNIYARSNVDDNEQNLLHLAARFGHVEVIRYIGPSHKQLVNARDKNGKTPLQLAEYFKRNKVIEYLTNFDISK